MPTFPFYLTNTIGRSYAVRPDDTERTKVTLRKLGYYETPSYGITPYPDEPMFRGIEDFQDDFDLNRDGVMNPDGETVAKLNEVSIFTDRASKANSQVRGNPDSLQVPQTRPEENQVPSTETDDNGYDGGQTAMAPAIPVIVYEIAALFGMTVAAAYAWWLSLSVDEKKRVRGQVRDDQERDKIDDPNDDECEKLFKIDIDTCRQIAKNRDKSAAARCYASANERYAACRRGKPRDQWPPLDTWNN